MMRLGHEEKALLLIHKHWLIPTIRIGITLFVALIPLPILPFLKTFIAPAYQDLAFNLTLFLISLYWLILLLGIFILWVEYWLDIWLVTNKRVLSVDQMSLFKRKISEFHVDNLQDITVTIPGFLGRVFNFGTIDAHTAGQHHFMMRDVPNPNAARRIVLDSAEYFINRQ